MDVPSFDLVLIERGASYDVFARRVVAAVAASGFLIETDGGPPARALGDVAVFPGDVQKTLDAPAIERVHGALAALGVASAPLPIDGVVDTSDYCGAISLTGTFDGNAFRLEFAIQSSGYRGEGAPHFADLVEALLRAAGLPAEHPAWRIAHGAR